MDALNAKQHKFVMEYLVDLNATQAAIRAGYSAKTADVQGPRLLGNAGVQAAIKIEQDARQAATGITVDRVLQEYAKVAFANMDDYIRRNPDGTAFVDVSNCSREQMAAVAEIHSETYWEPGKKGDAPREVKKVKLKLASKLGALDSIGKHLGMFVERIGDPNGKAIPLVIYGCPMPQPKTDES